MARKAFAPTDEHRHLVTVLSAYGIRQEDIATEIGLRSPKTLRKHFRDQLDRGRIGANIRVGKTYLQMATSGKNTKATISLYNRRFGFQSRPAPRTHPPVIPDFVVGCHKEAV